MWSPTHIKVTIRGARNLLTKGKNNTNNCFVTIGLGKERYQTSVKEKAEPNVNWNEECELKIPDQGNRAELVLTCLHHNSLGIDEFLGQVTLPLNEMDVYDRPRAKWFKLESKPGKEKKNKERGELDVLISFTVKSGSLADLSKKEKHKSSIGQLASSVGGSLLSIGTIEKRKGIKKIAKSLGSKMHLHSKKKNKEGDDSSFSGSFTSIGTSNRVKVIDSEDEDEFQFDNLSQKSSVSSLNMRDGLQPPNVSNVPRNSSPLLGSTGKAKGKDLLRSDDVADEFSIDELEKIESDFSVRARPLPPPSKPPRTPLLETSDSQSVITSKTADKEKQLDEWESKLYGKHLDIGSSDSLKRRSWEPVCVPLPTANEESQEELEADLINENAEMNISKFNSSSGSDSDELEIAQSEVGSKSDLAGRNATDNDVQRDDLISPVIEKKEFNKFNASFAKFEQRNSGKLFDLQSETKTETETFIRNESQAPNVPQPSPRIDVKQSTSEDNVINGPETKAPNVSYDTDEIGIGGKRCSSDSERPTEVGDIVKNGLDHTEEERREAKRREEDQRILSFSKRLLSVEENDEWKRESLGEGIDKREDRFTNLRFFNKRERKEGSVCSTPSPQASERIIIGHEKSASHAERRAEISAALAKKYEGKSREELMLIANGMENEALLQRQRVKELEDYLDNLLLRVMETHPKILQNPYSRTTSAKSG